MNFVYILSLLFLSVNFLFYKKSDNSFRIISWIIYTICLIFCYNTVSVYFLSSIKLAGNLLNYIVFNFVLGVLMLGYSIYKKEFQKYYFDKGELFLTVIIVFISFLIGYFRFDGFTSINYMSGDPSIHHIQAVYFSEELEILNEHNSKNIIYDNFDFAIPASYINCGFLINVFSNVKSYTVFLVYDTICFVMYSALFVVTLFSIFDDKKKKYLYMFIITLFYILAFPLNNLLFGFCYLGIGVMNINLLILFILWFKDKLNTNIMFKIINLFILSLSLFLTYYLYVPCIYLAFGLYYIYLWKTDKITFKQMMLYGIITLIIPFIIGFCRSMLPGFIYSDRGTIFENVTFGGSQYSNYTPFLLYVYFVIYYISIKEKKKNIFGNLNIVILSLYILIFIILKLIGYAELYYLYKLFYLYWLFVLLTIAVNFIKFEKIIYIFFIFIMLSCCLIFKIRYTDFGNFLSKFNIYNWNAKVIADTSAVVYTKDELEIVDVFNENKNICVEDDKVIILENNIKNMWFYSITGVVPGRSTKKGGYTLTLPNMAYNFWDGLSDYPCAIYFKRDNSPLLENDHEILFKNDAGVILKRK